MSNTKSSKKNVKPNKSILKQNAQSNKKIISAKNNVHGESKQAKLIKLLKRFGGATIEEMTRATDWQQHSIRGMISGVLKKRLGLSVSSEKEERGRVYRITV